MTYKNWGGVVNRISDVVVRIQGSVMVYNSCSMHEPVTLAARILAGDDIVRMDTTEFRS